jgi:hypothetical protein
VSILISGGAFRSCAPAVVSQDVMAHIPIATCRSRPISISPFDGTTAIILGPGRLRNENPAGVNRRAAIKLQSGISLSASRAARSGTKHPKTNAADLK